MIIRQEVKSKTGKSFFVYKENGSFVSKKLFEEQEKMEKSKKRNNRKKPKAIIQEVVSESLTDVSTETQIVELDKSEEWVGESGIVGIEVKTEEGSKNVSFDEVYKQGVIDFEQSIQEEIETPIIPQDKIIQEKLKEPIKTKGFFETWFKKWIW